MTSRQVYEALLTELNKKDAPNILLEDFNYFCNKAINQYVNKSYNRYDINQQTTDDLRVLKSTALLEPIKCDRYGTISEIGRIMDATYEVILPQDYVHLLNCICIYKVNKTFKCYNAGSYWRCAAKRLTSDLYSQVLDNFWNRPTYKNPYYFLHEVNSEVNNIYQPTNNIRSLGGGDKVASSVTGKYVISPGIKLGLNNINDAIKNGDSSIEGIHNVGSTMQYIWVAYPKYDNVTLWKNVYNGSEGGMQVITSTPEIFGDYKVVVTVQPCAGEIYFKCDPQLNVNIGNDYILGEINGNYTGTDGNPVDLGTDGHGNQIHNVTDKGGIPNSMVIRLDNGTTEETSTVERTAQVRYGNATQVRMEIRYGQDHTVFQLHRVYVDYIKAPQHIRLTQEQLDLTEDTSQVLEFPDYVCQEIINELVHIVMENIGDPKLQTHPVVSQSIATQQQQEQPAARQQQ